MNTLDAQELTKRLWADGVDTDFVMDEENEYVVLEASCYGQKIRISPVWGDPDEFFLDVGDVALYQCDLGEVGFLGTSTAETVEDLSDEVLFHLGIM